MTATSNRNLVQELCWTEWQPLQGSWLDRTLPEQPGLYRIRRAGFTEWDYVGQTGRRLRDRLSDLKGIYRTEMPYRAPHTVGPALWALLDATACAFEVSVAPVAGDHQHRKTVEAAVISVYRQDHGGSPGMNFGRMPHGYRMSSDNSAKLAARGGRFRGGLCTAPEASHLPGLPAVGPLEAPWHAGWCGHSWAPWQPIEMAEHLPTTDQGLYLLRGRASGEIIYIGQGFLRHRLIAHRRKQQKDGHPQGRIFLEEGGLDFTSVTLPGLHDHQRLELENDLIAAFLLTRRVAPRAQFLGEG